MKQKIYLAFFAILLILVIFPTYLVNRYNSFSNKTYNINNCVIDVKKGESYNSIFYKLADKNILKNSSTNRIFYKIFIKNKDYRLKTGHYFFNGSYSLDSLLNEFTKGTPEMVKITIPEGETAEQIASILSRKLNIDSTNFMDIVLDSNSIKMYNLPFGKNLRGFLFPQTYMFNKGSDINQIVSIMTKEFIKIFNRNKKSIFNNKFNDYEILIMASIIEKEAARDEDRDKIASVYYNRLFKNMKLQSCPTVRFSTKNFNKPLTYKELKVDNIYNTYKNYGLPPTPICNPGEKSIIAAFNPQKTNYLYFVALGDGSRGHHFSNTLKEHNRYKAKYKRRIKR